MKSRNSSSLFNTTYENPSCLYYQPSFDIESFIDDTLPGIENEKDKLMVKMFLEGYTYQEIGLNTNTSHNWAYKVIQKYKPYLKEKLEEHLAIMEEFTPKGLNYASSFPFMNCYCEDEIREGRRYLEDIGYQTFVYTQDISFDSFEISVVDPGGKKRKFTKPKFLEFVQKIKEK